jgi:N-acetylglucosamine-6-phosphate deacetylase
VIVISGGDLVLPDRVVASGSLLIDGDRIAAVESRPVDPGRATVVDARDCYVVPGFVDVHVHGLHGRDTLDGPGAVAAIAADLPRYGVTGFCPTTVACGPDELRAVLRQVRQSRTAPVAGCARVLPAHLESNFINPDFCGAQPIACVRVPSSVGPAGTYSGKDVLDVIADSRPDVGIVTLAPEIPGGLDLVRSLVAAGHHVSLGHTGADFETAMAAIEAGAGQATHLFNRMTPMMHRAPGVVGAVLERHEVTAELIVDGFHVHQAACRLAIAAKGAGRIMAITDATAGAGLPAGATATLGTRPIRVSAEAVFLEDGTPAGSTLTMDRAFENLVRWSGGSLVAAATMCATTPARSLGLVGCGVLTEGATADLVVLDRGFRVVHTFIGGACAFTARVS